MSMVKKRRGKFRKVFLPILIFIVSVLIIIGYGHHKFRVYSIYYAQNIPHKSGTAPVMCAVIDNLNSIYIPNLNEKSRYDNWRDVVNTVSDRTGVIEYDFVNNSILIGKTFEDLEGISPLNQDKFISGINMYTRKKIGYVLNFNITKNKLIKEYKVYYSNQGRFEKISIIENNAEKGVNAVEYKNNLATISKLQQKLYGSIIQKRKIPLINLQMLYNWLNYKRFNL